MSRQVSTVNTRIGCSVRGNSGPWVVMSHSLGCCQDMWDIQTQYLSRSHRVLTYDLPGHGGSDASGRQGSLELLAQDLFDILDKFNIERAHFVGISIGGMIGQVAALAQPDRFYSLVLANTSCKMPETTHPDWLVRINKARNEGVGSLAMPSLERWFTADFRATNPAVIERLAQQFAKTTTAGYVECCEAIMGLSTQERLSAIKMPTLVIAGSKDLGAPVIAAEALKSQLQHGTLEVIGDAGHLSCIDHSNEFNRLVATFLGSVDSAKKL